MWHASKKVSQHALFDISRIITIGRLKSHKLNHIQETKSPVETCHSALDINLGMRSRVRSPERVRAWITWS